MATGESKMSINGCNIGDQGCKYFVSGPHKYVDTHSTVTTLRLLNMDMHNNAISHHGLYIALTLLKIGCVKYLDLDSNSLLSEQDNAHATFDTFAEQLKNNTTLRKLWPKVLTHRVLRVWLKHSQPINT